MKQKISKLDKSSVKFNQGSIVLLVSTAFVFDLQWLVAFVSIILLAGSLFPAAGLFKLIYFKAARPLGLIKPEIIEEDNLPHLFAQCMGGIFLMAAFIFMTVLNKEFIGWSLSLIVVVLAFVNLTLNFCAGCFIYFQLNKLGFFQHTSGKEHA